MNNLPLTKTQWLEVYFHAAQNFIANFFKPEEERHQKVLDDTLLYATVCKLPTDEVSEIVDMCEKDYMKRIQNCLNDLGAQADYMALMSYRSKNK